MEFPIILDDGGDIAIFMTRKEVSRMIEPADLVHETYSFWDAGGFLLEYVVEGYREKPLLGIKWFTVVDQSSVVCTFRRKHPETRDVEGLCRRLRMYVIAHGAVPTEGSMENLMHQAVALHGQDPGTLGTDSCDTVEVIWSAGVHG